MMRTKLAGVVVLIMLSFFPFASLAADLDVQREKYVVDARAGDFRALEGLQQLHREHPTDEKIVADLLSVLVWAGQAEEAIRIYEESNQHVLPNYAKLFLVQAYTETGDLKSSLELIDALIQANPDEAGLQLRKSQLLIDLGAPFAAENILEKNRNVTDLDLVPVLSLKGVLYLRWSTTVAKNEGEKRIFALKALSYQFQAISLLKNGVGARNQIRAIELDIVVSLSIAGLFEEAFALYDRLQVERKVPAYVSLAAANTLLQLKKPEEAVELLLQVIEEEPGNANGLSMLFYGYIESEAFREAEELAENMANERPPTRTFLDSTVQYPNYGYLDGVVLSVLAKLYSDRLAAAWDEVQKLVENAPANSWFRQVSGETALARSLPRLALKEFRTARMLDPENAHALAGEGNALIRLYDYDGAEKITEKLVDEYPLVSATEFIVEDFELTRSPQLWGDFKYTYSEGPEQFGGSVVTGAEFISSPVYDNLRLSSLFRYSWSELPEGEESLLSYGLGFEYIKKLGGIYGLVNYNESTVSAPGGRLRTSWTPDDHWTVTLDGALYSDATPLRALYYDINMDKVGGAIAYRWNEQRNLRLSLSTGFFSDDNERVEGGVDLTQRLVDIPRLDLDATVSLYSSSNTRRDAPYFNPESDFSGRLILKGGHILYRHYDTSVTHDLTLGGGIYTEEGYDSDWVGNIGYEQQYQYNKRFEGRAGVEVGRNVYDGDPEPYFSLNLMIHAKF
jgi:biofilm PGA synthesis protein PgaA